MSVDDVDGPEQSEERFRFGASQARDTVAAEISAHPEKGKEEFREAIAILTERLIALAKERGGADEYIWLSYELALAYGHFAEIKSEFLIDFIENLDWLDYVIQDFFEQDENLAVEWKQKTFELRARCEQLINDLA